MMNKVSCLKISITSSFAEMLLVLSNIVVHISPEAELCRHVYIARVLYMD